MKINELDTPALIIDRERMLDNAKFMQAFADKHGVALRPHTKTHKMPEIARITLDLGACGIAVAKVGEAEAMADRGFKDIFIANEIVGKIKLERILELQSKGVDISFGIDCPYHVREIEEVFKKATKPAQVLIEIEVGENRSGIIEESDYLVLLDTLKECPHVHLKGLFSHDGNTYGAPSVEACREIAVEAQRRTVRFAEIARENGLACEVVSYGSTPTLMNEIPIVKGITELRPGTYIFMDAGQSQAIGTYERCAATVLATVISKPTPERTIMDVGAKGLTKETRKGGICDTPGMGTFLDYPHLQVTKLYDEHTIIINKEFHDLVEVGDKLRIIPVHICPVCNLYDTAYLVSGDEVVAALEIAGRGRQQ